MKRMKISKFAFVFAITIFLIFIILLKNMAEKAGFHIDEFYSYGLSNSYYQPFPWEFDTWLDGNYYQNYLTVGSNEVFSYGSVYYNQVQDVHPPLYYFILHTISSLFPGVFSKWIGLSLNLVIHFLVFYFLYLLLNKIINNKWVSLFGATFWILSKGAVDSLLFIRMYALLTLIQIMLLYITIKFYNEEKKHWNLLYLFLLICLGGLTHYYFYIYAFLLTLTVCIILLLEKKIKRMLTYGLTASLGVISAMAIFPAVFTHVFESNRGQEVLEGFENNLVGGNSIFLEFIHEDILRNVPFSLIVLLIFMLLVFLLYKLFAGKSKPIFNNDFIKTQFKIFFIISFPVLNYIFIVQQVSHYKTPRYIFGVYPIIVISLFIAIYYVLYFAFNNKKTANITIGILTFLITFFGIATQESDYKYETAVYVDEYIEDVENQNVLVLMDEYWKISNYVLDLRHFDKVYPVEISNNPAENLPEDNTLYNIDSLYVIYNKNENLNTTDLENLIKTEYNFEDSVIITESSAKIIYKFD